jgi:hypothetical protein
VPVGCFIIEDDKVGVIYQWLTFSEMGGWSGVKDYVEIRII